MPFSLLQDLIYLLTGPYTDMLTFNISNACYNV